MHMGFLLMVMLQDDGYRVRVAKDGVSALELLKREHFDICLLDVMMPKLDGMTSAYMQYPTGLDFCPLLEGLERDHCQCPHWGFVIEGRIRVNYEDGTEEVVGAGEIYYWPSGHTVVVEEAVRMVEFSPHDQMSQVVAHVVGKL